MDGWIGMIGEIERERERKKLEGRGGREGVTDTNYH
jgi:hypothetical protein